MTQVQSYERSLARSRHSLSRSDRPKVFRMGRREWDLLDEVFAPVYSPSTQIALGFVGLGCGDALVAGAVDLGPGCGTGTPAAVAPPTGSFLDLGCGTGIIGVSAALAGCERVTAVDINPRAVVNARVNAVRHRVAAQVRAVQSDLFAGLAGERFDTVLWSSNYVRGPEEYTYRSLHECAYVDPGYRTHRRFVAEAPGMLAPGGRALLHFSDRGDVAGLYRIARETGRELHVLRTLDVLEYGKDPVAHMLIEVRGTGS
ncbi:methyltransferase [Streptomyces sp. NPDC089919]|uniref:methyltransferase n=1 Tax=Streptomyces sp. NPDC089919 TaxID=3155188 RepID=UPI0034424653